VLCINDQRIYRKHFYFRITEYWDLVGVSVCPCVPIQSSLYDAECNIYQGQVPCAHWPSSSYVPCLYHISSFTSLLLLLPVWTFILASLLSLVCFTSILVRTDAAASARKGTISYNLDHDHQFQKNALDGSDVQNT